MANSSLGAARKAKNDEFYTQWVDIEREMNAYLEFDPVVFKNKTVLLPCDDPEWSNFTKYFALHFEEFGLKKLISTSYAPMANQAAQFYTPTLFETESQSYDMDKSLYKGRVFTLVPDDIDGDGQINIDDLRWEYLEGDGDFRSEEVSSLRDEADIVITNPPFSLFREFLGWLIAGNVNFSIIGNTNAITYKEVFPLIRDNKMWMGNGFAKGNAYFRVPDSLENEYANGVFDRKTNTVHFRNVNWFTNIEHGRRHEPLQLMTMEQNKRFGPKKVIEAGYQRYVNFDAIEVPFTAAIPSDFEGLMGVPISFLDRYNPDQFELVANMDDHSDMKRVGAKPISESFMQGYREAGGTGAQRAGGYWVGLEGPNRFPYKRIFIKHKNPEVDR